MRIVLILVLCAFSESSAQGPPQTSAATIARIRYRGGGDWYNDPSVIPNLARFVKDNTRVRVEEREIHVGLDDESLFSYPILFLTGHGRILLSETEAERLRSYLLNGGFLFADDDYGMDVYFRAEMRKVFPDRDWVELPFSHGIYRVFYRFDHGLPKIHEHDKKPPAGFGLLDGQGRLMVFYSYESNISDGWADPDVHGDPAERRETALRMGANIVLWAFLE